MASLVEHFSKVLGGLGATKLQVDRVTHLPHPKTFLYSRVRRVGRGILGIPRNRPLDVQLKSLAKNSSPLMTSIWKALGFKGTVQ